MAWPPTTSCNNDKKHNYGFSVAGSGEFKYKKDAGDKFKFVGDDDMWIFIDGELFEDTETGAHADLGGNHLAAPVSINIDRYASQKGWKDASTHVINFFYMERQVDDSNLYLEMSLSDLKPPRFGAPYIMEATTIISTDGISKTTIYVNNELDIDHFNRVIDAGGYPIIMHKANKDSIWGFKFDGHIEKGVDAGSKGYAYTIVGQLCRTPDNCSYDYFFTSGDSLSFNVLWADIDAAGFKDPGFALQSEYQYIKSLANKAANKLAWGKNTTRVPPVNPSSDYCLIKL
jgi:fibro-slime domain-containing protein